MSGLSIEEGGFIPFQRYKLRIPELDKIEWNLIFSSIIYEYVSLCIYESI